MSFDFGSAESWETSTDALLPVGNHAVTIVESEPGMTERDPKPDLELRVENETGSLRDWIVITPKTIGKVVQVFEAAGVARPGEGEYDPTTGALTEACAKRLLNKKVGVVVREEKSFKDETKMISRIAGYVTVDRVGGSNARPAATAGVAASSTPLADDDIPF